MEAMKGHGIQNTAGGINFVGKVQVTLSEKGSKKITSSFLPGVNGPIFPPP